MSSGKIAVQTGRQYDPDVNLMAQDLFHMAQKIGSNVTIMFATHPHMEMKYLIVVDTRTGGSIRIDFPEGSSLPDLKEWREWADDGE